MKRFLKVVMIVSLAGLTACSWWGNNDDDDNGPYKGMTARQLFTSAEKSIADKEYGTAAKRLEALDSMYPFSDFAEKAQMNLIFAYYQNGDYHTAYIAQIVSAYMLVEEEVKTTAV